MADYDGSIRINTSINTKEASSQLMSLENRISKTADKIASLRSKMESLRNTKIPTEEYKEISSQIEKTTQKISELEARQEKFLETGGKESSSTYKKMQYDIEELRNSLPYLEGELQDLVDTGKAFTLGSDTEEYAKTGQQLQYLEKDFDVLNRRHDELASKPQKLSKKYKEFRVDVTKALKKIGNTIKKSVVSSFKILGNVSKSVFSKIGKSAKKSNGILSTMASRFKGLALSLLIFNQISKAFNSAISGMKEGMKNLAQYSSDTNKALSLLMSRSTYLKNALATAFSPIVETITPILVSFIELLGDAATKVSELFSALMGKDTFTKAVKVQQDYADSLKDTAKNTKKAAEETEKALAPFDDLRQIQFKQNEESDSSEGSSLTPADMFQTQNIGDQAKKLSDAIKKAWKSTDFTGLGSLIGEKLKSALDGIPWERLKETARNIGKSLATLINGFVEVKGLGYSIGKTLIEGINTAFEFLNSFVHNLHWDSIGKFISDTVNGFFVNIDWQLIYDTFITGAKGVGDAINAFSEYLNWDAISTAVSNFVNTFVDTIYSFFNNVKWEDIGKNVGKFISDSLNRINWANIGKSLGTSIQSILNFLLQAIQNIKWTDVGTYIATALNNVASSIDLSTVGEILGKALTGILEMVIDFAKTFDWKEFGENVAGGINSLFENFDGAKFAEAANLLLSGILDTIISASENIDWKSIWEDIFDFLANIDFSKMFTAIQTVSDSIFEGFIQYISELNWGEVWDKIVESFKSFFGNTDFFQTTMEMQGGLLMKGLIYGVDKMKPMAEEKFNELKDTIFQKWEDVKTGTSDKWNNIKTNLSGQWSSIKENARTSFQSVKDSILQKWKESETGSLSEWNAIKNILSSKWSELKISSSTVFGDIKNNISSAWESVKTKTGNTWNGMKNLIKSPINAIIGFINGLLRAIQTMQNAIASALNKIDIDLPDWAENLTGVGSIGFDIPKWTAPKIPALATGTVVPPNREFLATLGDNKREPEVVSPVSTIEQAVENVLGRLGVTGGGQSDRPIYLQIDGKTFARLMGPYTEAEKTRVGIRMVTSNA